MSNLHLTSRNQVGLIYDASSVRFFTPLFTDNHLVYEKNFELTARSLNKLRQRLLNEFTIAKIFAMKVIRASIPFGIPRMMRIPRTF